MRWWDDLLAIPPASLGLRLLYALLLAVGVTMTMMGSMFYRLMGPIPYALIPDVRVAATLLTGLLAGAYAAGGGAHRRGLALWSVVGFVVAFHLEEATVHWIGPIPGSITGTPVGILGTLGSLLALVAVLLLHVEVEAHRLARDLMARGASEAEARGLASRLAAAGAGRVLSVAAGVAGLGALVLAVSPVFGTEAPGGAFALVPGGLLLLGVAVALARWVPRPAVV